MEYGSEKGLVVLFYSWVDWLRLQSEKPKIKTNNTPKAPLNKNSTPKIG